MNSPKTYLIAVLALTTIGGAVLCWQQYVEISQLRTAALTRNERADLQKRVWELERANKQLSAQSGSRPPGEGPDGGGPGGPPPERRGPGRGGPGGNPGQQLAALRDIMAKPEVQALMSIQQKAAVEARYAALFKSLNLTPDQADKLKSILAERTNTLQDVMAAARDQGIDPRRDPDGYQKLMDIARTDINNNIKSVIGESGFSQYENYEETLPQRNAVSILQQRLSYTDTPLTEAQSNQLIQILAANTPPPTPRTSPDGPPPGPGGGARGGVDPGALGAFLTGGGPGGGGGLLALGADPATRGANATAPITTPAITQSQTVLSPPQVAALQQLQQQQQSQQQLVKIVTDTMAAQNPANSPPKGPAPKN